MKTLNDINFQNKTVLLRADLNVPLDDQLKITNTARIRGFAPTAKKIIEAGGKIVLISHLGRPKGEANPKFSLKSVQEEVAEETGTTVHFAADCIGDEAERMAKELKGGEILLLENLRFHAGEKSGDSEFAKKLAGLADIYVNDAFGTAHRAHASMVAVADLLTEKAAGLLMEKEIEYFEKALVNPKRPLCVVLGGAKISSKLPVLQNLSGKADAIIIGGAMANTFLAQAGADVGTSLYEPEMFGEVAGLLKILEDNSCKLHLPIDFKVAKAFSATAADATVAANEIPVDMMALDIGPKSAKNFAEVIMGMATIVWNGPMGACENPAFAEGTLALTKAIADSSALSVVGGGDTVAAVEQMKLAEHFDFLSTGGGAFLELMEGKELPGIVALG